MKKRAKWFLYLKMGNQQQRMTEQPREIDKMHTQHPETDGVDSSLTSLNSCTVSQRVALVGVRFETKVVLYPSTVHWWMSCGGKLFFLLLLSACTQC